jgi:diacylglycerol O-acyltransferase
LFAAGDAQPPEPKWTREPAPGAGALLHAALDLATNPLGLLRPLGRALRAPKALARRVADTASGLGRMATALAPVAASSLTGPIGQPRRYAIARASLADMRTVGTAFGVTVNDVALAAISLAFRAVLLHRGEQPGSHTLRAMVPVSVRSADRLDNQISVMLPMLPVEFADPPTVLGEVHRRLAELKHSKEAQAGQAVTALAEHEPTALISRAIRLAARLPQRNIVTVTTNVPGSPVELAVLDRPILEVFPYVPIAVRLRTGVAALSYRDHMAFGITADFDSNRDVDVLARALEAGIADLVEAAGATIHRTRKP